jgi:hypothetical protein
MPKQKINKNTDDKITTIKLSEKTKSRLSKLQVYSRETYDETLNKAMDILNITRTNPERARSALIRLESERRRNKV